MNPIDATLASLDAGSTDSDPALDQTAFSTGEKGTPADLSSDDTLIGSADQNETLGSMGSAARLTRGSLIGRYVVLRELGAGGMGVVYAAEDPDLDRKVALKLLRPDTHGGAGSASSTDARTRLLREAQSLAKLSHPNVVAIHVAHLLFELRVVRFTSTRVETTPTRSPT